LFKREGNQNGSKRLLFDKKGERESEAIKVINPRQRPLNKKEPNVRRGGVLADENVGPGGGGGRK